MTIGYIQEYIPVRMRELGIGKAYRTEMRSIMVPPGEMKIIKSYNSWVFIPADLLAYASGLVIESDASILDLNTYAYNELGYEHTGTIKITNPGLNLAILTFVQAISNYKKF